MTKIKSILRDGRIEAYNALVEIKIGEYLKFSRNIIDNNEFQRKKVIKSKIKEILQEDLLRNCLVPSIVLAVTNKQIDEIKDIEDIETAQRIIDYAISENEVLIIDGLQRTYVLMSLEDELLKKGMKSELATLHNHTIRAEIYLGINRTGLLYRMITLNTGQTTMSTRHLMEILYSDYARTGINGISLVKDKDESTVDLTTQSFNFKMVLDGFNSYLEKNEALIERTEILDNIKSLDVMKDEEGNKDLFNDFLMTYKEFLDRLLVKVNNWQYDDNNPVEQALQLNTAPFGMSFLDIFKRSQALTGFGAAVGYLKEFKLLNFGRISSILPGIYAENDDWNIAFGHLLKHLDLIKEKSKKIGHDQRYFFKVFFRTLLSPDSDHKLNFNKSSDTAYNRTREDRFN